MADPTPDKIAAKKAALLKRRDDLKAKQVQVAKKLADVEDALKKLG